MQCDCSNQNGLYSRVAYYLWFPIIPILRCGACTHNMNRERPGPFYHMNDVSVYIGRQRGEESSIKKQKTSLSLYLVVSAPSAGVSSGCKAINVPLQVRNKECVHKMCSFNRGPLPLCLSR